MGWAVPVLHGGLLAGGLFYAALIAWLGAGIRRSRRDRRCTVATPSVSVLVAGRDEETHNGAGLAALRRQDYDGELEIVVVDDRSADGTAAVVEAARSEWRRGAGPNLILLSAPDPPRYSCPKKSALAAAVEASHGQLLLFTDADCAPPPVWVRRLAARFTDGVGLVAGYAYGAPLRRWRERLLAVDNLGVGALAEGSIGMGAAWSCTGRSLAYRRAVWDEVGGFEAIGHHVGGDDVYFLRQVVSRTHWTCVFCAHADAAVPGDPGPASWRRLFDQKVRHASKVGHYRGRARWAGLAAYGFYALMLAELVRGIAFGDWGLAPPVAAVKLVVDAGLLWTFAPRQRRDRVLLTFLPFAEAFHLPYVLFFVPLGRAGRFRWKEGGGAVLRG